MNRSSRTTAQLVCALAVACVAAPTLTGCTSNKERMKQHALWKQAAEDKWNGLRSGVSYDIALQQFNAGKLDKALTTITQAVTVDTDNPRLYTLAGRIHLEQGELEQAFKVFTNAIAFAEKDPRLTPGERADPYYFQGVVLQRWTRSEEALERYESARDVDPSNASRLLAVAETLVELGRLEDAVALLEEKLTFFDQNASLRVALAQIHNLRGDFDKAATFYGDALLLDPENNLVREAMARTLIQGGDRERGLPVLRMLLDESDYAHRTDLMRTVADAELEEGRAAEARQCYIDITRLEPGSVNDWIKLGELSWRVDDTGGTLIAANRVMELAPSRHEGYLMAGMVWQKRSRLVDALRLYDRAAELSGPDPRPLLMRGLALQKAGKHAAARRAYQQALERRPGDKRATRLLDAMSTTRTRTSAAPADASTAGYAR